MDALPFGYTARPARMEDLEAAVEMLNAYSLSVTGVIEDSVESQKQYWQSPGFHLDTDTQLIFTPEGQLAGYTEFWDWGEPHVRLIGWSAVHPKYQGLGLGKFLLEWSIQRARQHVAKAPADAQVVLQHFAESTNQGAAALFTACGFLPVRSTYIMRIEFDQPPEPPSLPEGIRIRSIANEEEERAAIFVAHESFLDHWGNTNPPFEEYYQRAKQRLKNDPHYDPALWFIALDGDEIAGISLCSLHTEEDPDLAWVGTLGVLRPWRRRGVGKALLQHSFVEFYRRGKKRAGLGVDAGSLTGAVRLYENAGMHVLRKSDIYELELRPGKEIMRRTIEEPSKIEEK